MTVPHFLRPFQVALRDFIDIGAPQSAAAMSFYAVTAIPPLLVVVTAIFGIVYSDHQAAAELVQQVTNHFGKSTGQAIADILARRAQAPNATAALSGSAILLIGASGFFSQLQGALNQVWGVEAKSGTAWSVLILKRLVSMTAVLGTGFLLLSSLVLSTILVAAGNWMELRLGWDVGFAAKAEGWVAMATLIGLFAFIFKVLPDVKVRWSDVWKGAVTTSVLFMLGKYALGWYLGRTDFTADYGSAGALILLLSWVYYTSLILLFGAELTKIQTQARGHEVLPDPHAERVRKIRESEAGFVVKP